MRGTYSILIRIWDMNTYAFAQACSKRSTDMTLLVDYRERRLAEVLEVPHLVRKLAVGDILCDYCAGNQWIAERKTATDLAASIISGRWRDQLHRLKETGCRVIFIVEGDLRATTFSYDSLLGTTINAELRKGSCVIRTVDLHETAAVIRHLVAKGEYGPGMPPSALTPPSAVSKRERDCDRRVCWTRMLMCVPTVSERIAKKRLRFLPRLLRVGPQGLLDLLKYNAARDPGARPRKGLTEMCR